MFTSLSNTKSTLLKGIVLTMFLVIFDIIYEQFSHGLNSPFMRFSFILPIFYIGIAILLFKSNIKEKYIPIQFWEMGLFTLIIGFLLRGIFDIYGTVDPLVYYFFYVGVFISVASISLHIYYLIKNKK